MKFPPTAHEARISEIFSSLQGEGTHVGERHIFIRFEECNIHCNYCDELHKPGQMMTMDQVMEAVVSLEKQSGPHAYVSLTGGEPLLYLKFLKPLMSRLKTAGFKTYLETAGILWKSLYEVLELCDCIAMDMKPPSVTGESNFDSDHANFMKLAVKKETFVKIVLSKSIARVEFDNLVEIIRQIDPTVPLVLQPVSDKMEGHEDEELMSLLSDLQRSAMASLTSVRIVPRLHRILKIR